VSKASLGLLLLLTAVIVIGTSSHALASPPIPVNQRVFYFTSSGALSTSPPTGTGSPSIANLTNGPLTFALPQLQPKSSITISGQIIFVLYTNWTVANPPSVPVSLVGILSYHYPSLDWTNRSSSPVSIQPGPQNVTIPLTVSEPPLLEQSTVTVQIKAISFPRNANVSLFYASNTYRSLVVIPMSGYETLYPSNTVSILDRFGNQPTFFPLNAAPGDNIVVVKLSVSSALGFPDIKQVNMTIVDPSQRPVHNATMQPSYPPNTSSPYDFIAPWVYPLNSTRGTYQVWINIVDSQDDVAFSFQGPSSFGLVPPGYVPFPYNLIPYIVVAGVAASGGVGGAAFYRRRKRKSYLIPFDHFNTLTGGGLNGGTLVTVEGNTGSGKTLFLEQLMGEDLRNGRPCVFVSTGDFPNSIRASMKIMGIDVSGYEQNGLLTFVDGYSAEAGQESREKVFIPSLGDLTTLSIKLTSAFPSPSFKGGSLYFDSLTPLASKARPDSIVSFVQSVGAKVKGLSGKAFFTVGLGIDGTVQRQLEDTADCIVQMEAFEESGSRKRRLRIAKFRARKHQEGWALFTIEDGKGIIFYSKKPKQ
jgi:KaiC/GvpD/RAD55 family RecA-like ATPase